MINEHLHTRIESIIENAIAFNSGPLQISGTSSPLLLSLLLAHSYSKEINRLPHVVVVDSLSSAQRFKELVHFFDPIRQVEIFESFDVSPYSGLYPKASIGPRRMGFLHKALNAKAHEIFVVPVEALLQRTTPRLEFERKSRIFNVGDEVPAHFSELLFLQGYRAAPMVEDLGQYSIRGGIIDIFSPAYERPIRIELFGDQIESLRFFGPADQRSQEELKKFALPPAKEYFFDDDFHQLGIKNIREDLRARDLPPADVDELLRGLALKQDFPGLDFYFADFFKQTSSPLDYFQSPCNFWYLDPLEITRVADEHYAQLKMDYESSQSQLVRPALNKIYDKYDELALPGGSRSIFFSNLIYFDQAHAETKTLEYKTSLVSELQQIFMSEALGSESWFKLVNSRVRKLKEEGYSIFVSAKNRTSSERLKTLLERAEIKTALVEIENYAWDTWRQEQSHSLDLVHIIPRTLFESVRLNEERILFLRDDDLLGKKSRSATISASEEFHQNAKRLSFGDLKPGDLVVHTKHGVGVYDGLKIMSIGGVESEYIQIGYKDKDKLYLPVYRVGQLQKYAGAGSAAPLDKLGGSSWEKTTAKVKKHLKDIAAELIQLYAKRAEIKRPPFSWSENDALIFENAFPFDETTDQLRALGDIEKDLHSDRPMDRLICGDVGFGKTEVAMRAAFLAIQSNKQVAVLAPTTVLTFQHFETFKKRFLGWPVEIRVLNRFVSSADVKKTLNDLKEGRVDLVIGTHKLLASNIEYKDLGLLIVDEEQKFGVSHKEKIKKLKNSVDTLTLSATPIPRTLNMSLVGIRDLSIINTAPVDRLPTRTFVTKFEAETIRKACESEIARGGQVYFIHNRVQSIYGVADEIRTLLPSARIRVAHGQMDEDELEKAMLAFFHHEIDILVCTAIVESGMDVSRANTMFIDDAHMFGLSQLYQLRGRVGRSKTRAYCYLLMPRSKKLDAEQQERLKIIQDNTALGSGLKIAQYDLELRGSGNLLGEDQSGHINSVGYEMYMDLLNEALSDAKGENVDDRDLDPEINLRVAAMIPDTYIKDIRIRLSYYKAMAEIRSSEDLDRIEDELRDQFGELPEQTVNLLGLMLIRKQCRDLGVRDVSAGVKSISLIFTEKTKLKPETIIKLAMRENKKYSITPDNRLNIRMNTIAWQSVYEELDYLCKLI